MAKVDVANKALTFLNVDTITSFNDDTEPARAMKVLYDSCKRFLLQSHNWRFAMKRSSLTKLGGHSDDVYRYAYQIPADCLKVIQVDGDCPEWHRFGSEIWTNLDPFVCEYIAEIDESLFSPTFEKVLQYYLAAEVSMKLTGSASLRGQAEQKYAKLFLHDLQRSDS